MNKMATSAKNKTTNNLLLMLSSAKSLVRLDLDFTGMMPNWLPTEKR